VSVFARAAAATLVAAAVHAAGGGSGSIVIKLTADPSPLGLTWSYAVAGQSVVLGTSGASKTVSGLADGTYRLVEQKGPSNTLTALTCADPSDGTSVDLKSATAAITLSSGETVTCTFTHRALGPRPAANAAKLAAQYAPLLRLASGEPYRPLRLEDYLTRTSLHAGSPPGGAIQQAHPTLFSLPVTAPATYLDVAGAEPSLRAARYASIERELESARARPTVYFHLAYQPVSQRVAIEYWFFYLYNDFYDKHEADWEGVTVFLHGTSPLGVSYSAHQGRRWSPWASQSTQNGTHPIVYVAHGSHANYSKRGRYDIRVCWTLHGRRHCAITPKADVASGTGPTLAPSRYDLQQLGGPPYTGDWGSGNYILGIGRTSDHVRHPHPVRQRNPRIGCSSIALGATPVWPWSKSKNATLGPDGTLCD
jgi:hypothetical protein